MLSKPKILFSRLFIPVLALMAMIVPAWGETCVPSRWGAADEIGAANLVTPARVLAATRLVKKGQSHPLGIIIDSNTPAFSPRSLSMQIVSPGQHNHRSLVGDFGWDITYNDDIAQLWFGIGPQIDGLSHLGESGIYYNCREAKDFVTINGVNKMGIEKIPPLIGRGVLIDMAKYFGVDALSPGQAIGVDDLKAAMHQQEIIIEAGDIVLIHTGWTDARMATDPDIWVKTEPGLDNAATAYLVSFDPVAVGSDTWGLEVVPPAPGDKVFYGHVSLLGNGIYILETMNTGRLAREQVQEFMFVLGQARVRGAVQMIINPVAMW